MEEGSLKFCRSKTDSDNSDFDISNASSEISDFLDQAGAQLKLSAEQEGLLLIAAARGISFVIKCLLCLGADPDVLDKDGLKPVQIAVAQGNREAVEVLRPVTLEVQEVLTLQRGTGKEMEEGSLKFWRSKADSDNLDFDTSNASSEILDFLDQAWRLTWIRHIREASTIYILSSYTYDKGLL